MSDARDTILGRIREALPGAPVDATASHAQIARAYQRTGALDTHACLDLFIDRLLDYDTEIFQVDTEAQIASAVADALSRAGERRVLTPIDLPATYIPADIQNVVDDALTIEAIDGVEAVVTTCEVAVASTGTIVLVHRAAQGRRILTLLPDHHVCLVRRDQVVETVPQALAWIAPMSALPITTISGPSATSDIEMTRIRGVHGPRRLSVVLYGALKST